MGINVKITKARWADEGDMDAYRRGEISWDEVRDEQQGLKDRVEEKLSGYSPTVSDDIKYQQVTKGDPNWVQDPETGAWVYRPGSPEEWNPMAPKTAPADAWKPSPEGASDYWMQQGHMDPTSEEYQNAQRSNMANSRASQLEGLDYLHRTATGQQSVAGEAMRQAIEQQQSSYAAQARAARSPAEARAALYQQAAAQQNSASAGAQAVLQEKQQAQQAYVDALQGLRDQDIQGLETETQARQSQAAENEMIMNMKGKYMAMGMAEEEANRAAAVDYQKWKENVYQHELDRQQGLVNTAQARDDAASAQAMQMWGAIIQGFATMGASALSKIK